MYVDKIASLLCHNKLPWQQESPAKTPQILGVDALISRQTQ